MPASGKTHAGYVAIVGLPNSGKSTLLNRIVGEKLSITNSKPQTTRRRLAGILTRGSRQVVFVDTPGLLDPTYPLQHALAGEVTRALDGVDLAYLLHGPGALGAEEQSVLGAMGATPVFSLLGKRDLLPHADVRSELARCGAAERFAECHAVSGTTGEGVEELLHATLQRMPAAAFFFDPEQLSDRSMRFLVAELVRETLFEELEQEVPYAAHVEVTAYEEGRGMPRIEATIFLERDSQKGIVIGRGGETLKRIGTRSRAKVEGLAGEQVFLQLHVKVRQNWRRRDVELRRFGYRA
ncbi:MAG: GTPase Era [Gemmatimonadetes bacterium]|nr:GTPase Era [Gemmatimonadota bacterium]